MSGRHVGLASAVLVIVGVVLIGTSAVLGASAWTGRSGWVGGATRGDAYGPSTMRGDGYGPGMMGGSRYGPGAMGGSAGDWSNVGPQPGDAGFVAGTADAPRLIRVIAGPGYTFTPAVIAVQRGETVTFEVTTMGPMTHEFMVGPAASVAADQEGTPEIADIGMMETRSLTYTFDGIGPFAFACHAPGHYEAGMAGTITVVG